MTNKFVSSVLRRVEADLASELSGSGFNATRVAARADNAYICNDTNWRGLTAVAQSQEHGGRLKAAFFVHIPYASPKQGDHAALGKALAVVISRLVDTSVEMAGRVVEPSKPGGDLRATRIE